MERRHPNHNPKLFCEGQACARGRHGGGIINKWCRSRSGGQRTEAPASGGFNLSWFHVGRQRGHGGSRTIRQWNYRWCHHTKHNGWSWHSKWWWLLWQWKWRYRNLHITSAEARNMVQALKDFLLKLPTASEADMCNRLRCLDKGGDTVLHKATATRQQAVTDFFQINMLFWVHTFCCSLTNIWHCVHTFLWLISGNIFRFPVALFSSNFVSNEPICSPHETSLQQGLVPFKVSILYRIYTQFVTGAHNFFIFAVQLDAVTVESI